MIILLIILGNLILFAIFCIWSFISSFTKSYKETMEKNKEQKVKSARKYWKDVV